MGQTPEGFTPVAEADLTGMVLRQVLAYGQGTGGKFRIREYPWAAYVFVAMAGADPAHRDRYIEVCHRLGVTTDQGRAFVIIGLWGYPEGSDADRAEIAKNSDPLTSAPDVEVITQGGGAGGSQVRTGGVGFTGDRVRIAGSSGGVGGRSDLV